MTQNNINLNTNAENLGPIHQSARASRQNSSRNKAWTQTAAHSSIRIMSRKKQTKAYGQEWREYSIKCKDCQAEYIGKTGKEVRKKITEHKNAIRRYLPYSSIPIQQVMK